MSEHEQIAEVGQAERCECQAYLRATEHAALVSARWLGRDDEAAAEETAATAMRSTLDMLPINGRVVFGSLDDSGGLTPGAIVGAGGKDVDLALDPLEGRGVVARGGSGRALVRTCSRQRLVALSQRKGASQPSALVPDRETDGCRRRHFARARKPACAPPRLRNAPAFRRRRPPRSAVAAGARRHRDNADLHPCRQCAARRAGQQPSSARRPPSLTPALPSAYRARRTC